MRERADAADGGTDLSTGHVMKRWAFERNETGGDVIAYLEVGTDHFVAPLASDVTDSVGQHVASWDPTVARAVADLLDRCASVASVLEFVDAPSAERGFVAGAVAVARAYRREVAT